MYKKIVSKGHLEYCFLKIRLDFEDDIDTQTTDIELVPFKSILVKAVTSLYGLTGAASQIDVLKYNPINREAIIRIHSEFLTKFWSAITLYSQHDQQSCAFRVIQVSSHLMAMANNSRTMNIEVEES